ncbi:hypothetical protein [Streptomyces lydicus]|uniref:hypothetical protein n=1 Tax=Streptomyces lydicus TaxID=47763 RepID=UPI00378AEAF0
MTNTVETVATSPDAATAAVPGQFDPEVEARLAQIDRDATQHVEDNRPERTRTSYAADWQAWERFTAETGLPLLAVRPGTLVLFFEWCWHQSGHKSGLFLAPSTIRCPGTDRFLDACRLDLDLAIRAVTVPGPRTPQVQAAPA